MKTSAKFAFVIPLIAAFWAAARVWPVLPAVMQDEYIYSSQSKYVPFAEQTFPNYLFSWLYSTTAAYGDNFYPVAKTYNLIFFLIMLVFIYLIAKRIIGHGWAIAITTVSAISPLHAYVSYFMPESMYMAFMFATIWLTLNAVRDGHWHRWALAGGLLGLTALVKPHAFFALPAFLVVAFIASLRQENGKWTQSLVKTLSFGASFFLIKFGIGFAFAGVKGLSLFGGYGTLDGVVGQLASGNEAVGAGAGKSFASVFFTVIAGQIPAHLAFMALIAGLPLLLSIRVIFSAIKKREPISELGSFVILTGVITISFALVVALFEGFVSAGGDDHSDRLLLRYYEFVLPLLMILGICFEKYVESKLVSRIIQVAVVLVASFYVLIYFPGHFEPQFSDSGLMVGILQTPGALFTIFFAEVLASLAWIFRPAITEKAIGRFILPLMILLMGAFSQGALMTQVGTQKAFFDIAGQTAKPYLKDVPGNEIVIIGPMRTQVFVGKFWIDKAGITDKLVPTGSGVALKDLKGMKYALLLDGVGVEGSHPIVASGDRFQLLKLDN